VTPELPEQTTDTNVGVPESQAYAFLEHWSLEKAHVSLAAHRENSVYRVDTPQGRSYALRIRRVGYRTDTELISELDWMTMLAKKGLRVPLPVAASDGSRMVCIGKDRADLVTWLNGKAIGASGESLTLSEATNTFRTLGKTAARLHLLSDQWTMPAGFNRPRWDSDALFGESPLWGRFWDCAELSQSDAGLFTRFREAASKALNSLHDALDMGLIHADLVRENVLVDSADPSAVALIDFDDGVFGYRLFEIATALVKNVNEPQYPAIRDALIEGYRELRPMNTSGLDLFMATRAATYVGWSAARLSEPGGQARFDRVTRAARDAASHWLSTSQYAFYQRPRWLTP
jgi:Ser/Thr protein kinase RdoA (MazF antagonist)